MAKKEKTAKKDDGSMEIPKDAKVSVGRLTEVVLNVRGRQVVKHVRR